MNVCVHTSSRLPMEARSWSLAVVPLVSRASIAYTASLLHTRAGRWIDLVVCKLTIRQYRREPRICTLNSAACILCVACIQVEEQQAAESSVAAGACSSVAARRLDRHTTSSDDARSAPQSAAAAAPFVQQYAESVGAHACRVAAPGVCACSACMVGSSRMTGELLAQEQGSRGHREQRTAPT